MNCKEKSWVWKLTWPFAHDNYTTVGSTIYYPRGRPPSSTVVAHEEVHERQWKSVGFLRFYLLYLLALPVLWNPWRYRWEREAGTTKNSLRSYRYGWLKNKE